MLRWVIRICAAAYCFSTTLYALHQYTRVLVSQQLHNNRLKNHSLPNQHPGKDPTSASRSYTTAVQQTHHQFLYCPAQTLRLLHSPQRIEGSAATPAGSGKDSAND